MGLGRRPGHLSAILKAEENQRPKADLDRLIEETAELAAWCASAEIPMLSIYEKTGAWSHVSTRSPIPLSPRKGEEGIGCVRGERELTNSSQTQVS